jgi:hypothetical protein
MTLKQKLNDSIITNINIVESENRMWYNYNHLELADECEHIADEFAIGFADWLISKNHNKIINLTNQERLEIYKKEKCL